MQWCKHGLDIQDECRGTDMYLVPMNASRGNSKPGMASTITEISSYQNLLSGQLERI